MQYKNPIGSIKKGGFHEWLGKSHGSPITEADIQKGLAAGGHAAKMANFARNAKNFNHRKKKSAALLKALKTPNGRYP